MKTFPLYVLIFAFLLTLSGLPACQRIDVDEHQYDTVTPYLPNIPPDPSVVTAPPAKMEPPVEADGDAENAEIDSESGKTVQAGNGLNDGLDEKVRNSTGELHLNIIKNPQQNAPAAPQK